MKYPLNALCFWHSLEEQEKAPPQEEITWEDCEVVRSQEIRPRSKPFFPFSLFLQVHMCVLATKGIVSLSNELMSPQRWEAVLHSPAYLYKAPFISCLHNWLHLGYNKHFTVQKWTKITFPNTHRSQHKQTKGGLHKKGLHNVSHSLIVFPGGGGRGTWVNVCWVCAAGLSEPLAHHSLFFGHL